MGQFHKEIFRGSEVINFNCQILNSVGYFVFHFFENLIDTEKYYQSIINFDINKHQIEANNHTSVFCLCLYNAHSDPTWHAQTTWSDPHAVLAICQTYFTTLKIYFSRTISNYF